MRFVRNPFVFVVLDIYFCSACCPTVRRFILEVHFNPVLFFLVNHPPFVLDVGGGGVDGWFDSVVAAVLF